MEILIFMAAPVLIVLLALYANRWGYKQGYLEGFNLGKRLRFMSVKMSEEKEKEFETLADWVVKYGMWKIK